MKHGLNRLLFRIEQVERKDYLVLLAKVDLMVTLVHQVSMDKVGTSKDAAKLLFGFDHDQLYGSDIQDLVLPGLMNIKYRIRTLVTDSCFRAI